MIIILFVFQEVVVDLAYQILPRHVVNICFQAVNPGPEEESKRQLTEQRPLVEKGSPFKKSIFEGFARLVKSEDVLGELDDGAEEQERQSDAG